MPVPYPKLRHAPEAQVALRLPAPLNGRLDVLTALGEEADEPVTRKALIASLVLSAAPDADELATRIRRYRTAAIADAFIAGHSPSRFLDPYRQPGPRPSSFSAESSAPDEVNLAQPAAVDRGLASEAVGSERLRHANVSRVGVSLPAPIQTRLVRLLSILDDVGERTSRQELVAALILSAPETPEAIGQILHRYRTATVGDADADLAPKQPPTRALTAGRPRPQRRAARR